MIVLRGLRKKLINFYYSIDNRIELKKFANIPVDELTFEEMSLHFQGDVLYSEDADFILDRLNSFFKILEEKDSSSEHIILKDFVYDISNWDRQVYVKESESVYWRYKTIVNNDMNEKNCILELNCDNNIVMYIDVRFLFNGKFLEFNSKYYTDISSYKGISSNSNSKYGTTVVNIKCSNDGNVICSNIIYDLDLLSTENFYGERLNDNVISVCNFSLTANKVRK